jgi:hypothetical protein
MLVQLVEGFAKRSALLQLQSLQVDFVSYQASSTES